MNVRSNKFGYLLPLLPGTNTVVVMGADGGRPDYGTQVSGRGTTLGSFDGYLYGTTTTGGSLGHGTVYKVSLATYIWSITGGTITSGQGTPSITWTAGSGGAAIICVTVSNSAVCSTNICSSLIPVTVPIAAGGSHSLAVLTNGTLWTWGRGTQHQLGDNKTDDEAMPVPISNPLCSPAQLSNVVALAGGSNYSVAVDANGIVWSWGDGRLGELGNGGNTNVSTPTPINGISNVVSVAAGSDHTLALCADGTVWAWGSNQYSGDPDPYSGFPIGNGQLGAGSLGGAALTNSPVRSLVLTGTVIVAIAAGNGFSLALDTTGSVWGWGGNQSGMLGATVDSPSGNESTNLPTLVAGISNVIAIAAGFDHSVALTAGKAVWTWGQNYVGQLAQTNHNEVPGPVTNLSGVVAITAGRGFTVALTTNGQVYAFGDNQFGELGTNTNGGLLTSPHLVAGISNAVLVSAHPNGYHCLAITVNQGTNQYYAWGGNSEGQIGDGGEQYQSTPTQLRFHFCDSCNSSVQLGTSGIFTAQCTGTLKLYFSDWIGIFYDNAGSYTATVNGLATNVTVIASNGLGVAVGSVTKGSNYMYSASGWCQADPQIPFADPDGKDSQHNPVDCTGSAGELLCPNTKCFSLVGRIQ